MRHFNNIKQNWCGLPLVLLALNIIVSLGYVTCSSYSESKLVKSLPGFQGDLPFTLRTGYIGVGKGDEVQLFYSFIESERNPETDPIMVWFAGGPGCCALSSFFFEHLGPLSFNYTGVNFNFETTTWETDLPHLQLNPYSWTKTASIIFLDTPVGTGLSYATTPESYYTVDVIAAEQIYEFMQKWFVVHPQFATNPFYVGASSYSGVIAPLVTQEIVKGNEDEHGSKINIKGYVLGSPLTDLFDADRIGRIEVMHRVSITSDELYKSSKVYCGPNWNVSSAECDKNLGYEAYLLSLLDDNDILEPQFKSTNRGRRWFRGYNGMIYNNWINNAEVRNALHVREGTVDNVSRCNFTIRSFTTCAETIRSSVGYHQYLTSKPIKALVYSGDQELTITYVTVQSWIKRLNVHISNHWRPWFINNQVVGYVTEYSNGHYNLTYTTMKGGGHCPSEYFPREAAAMFEQWLASKPF